MPYNTIMRTPTNPDPSELLAKALDLVVGGAALARYAAGHTPDRRLQRTFKHLEASGEHQARILREQLASYALPGAAAHDADLPFDTGSPGFIAGAVTAAVVLAGSALAVRVLLASDGDPLRRLVLGALSRLTGSTADAPAGPLRSS